MISQLLSDPEMRLLNDRLLAHGGSRVVLQPAGAIYMKRLLEQGRVFDGHGAKRVRGAQGQHPFVWATYIEEDALDGGCIHNIPFPRKVISGPPPSTLSP